MALPPIIERELRWRSKRAKTWYIRVGVVLASVFAFIIPMMIGSPALSQGQGSFLAVTLFPMLAAIFCGVVTTADCLSREKREATLDLLMLAPVSPFTIVAQKLIAVTAPIFSGLVAVLPLYALPALIGGVSGSQAFAAMVATIGTALVSAAIGCLASAHFRSLLAVSSATFAACAAIFGTSLLPGLATSNSAFVHLLNLWNPLSLYVGILQYPWIKIAFGGALLQLVNAIALAAVLMLLAAWVYPKRLRPPIHSGVLIPKKRMKLAFGTVSTLVVLGILLGHLVAPSQDLLLLVAAVLASTLTKLLVVVSAARALNCRQWLELVLTTPLPPELFVQQQAKELGRRIAIWIGVGLPVNLAILSALSPPFRELGIAVLVFLFVDAIALAAVGLWNGVKYRNVNEAVSLSLSSIILLPAIIAAVCMAFGFRTATLFGGVFLWALLCLFVDLLAASSARWMLLHRIRTTAAA